MHFAFLSSSLFIFDVWYSRDEDSVQARCHYAKAEVDGFIYDLYDDAHVKVSLDYTSYSFFMYCSSNLTLSLVRMSFNKTIL